MVINPIESLRKLVVRFFLAILCSGLFFISCSDNDLPVVDHEQTVEGSFFSEEVNRLIDENYTDVQAQGHAKLVIGRSLYSEDMFKFPANAKSDMDAMRDAGYEVYVNGGTVRDGIMGTEAHDVDFSTNADIMKVMDVLPHAEAFNAFRNIWLAKAYHGDELETDIAPIFSIFPELSGKADVPVTKYPDSPYCDDLMEDTYSRDFTFNAIYYDYRTGDIIDYHGGLHDLREGIVRTVFDADLAISLDARKIFRSIRFAAKYDYRIESTLDKAINENVEILNQIDVNNAVYQTVSGFNGGFALRFFRLLNHYHVTDYMLTSMTEYLHTEEYDKFVEGMLEAFDAEGKVDMALCYAAIFWPRFVKEIIADENPSADDVAAVWKAIDEDNHETFRFENVSYGDYSYVHAFIRDIWMLQLLMTDDDNMTAAKAAEIRTMDHYQEAVAFLLARAGLDSSLEKYAEYWN